ncbi:hypothetical protein DFH08DRAFT_803359 [Mycena albidolilacea]|uniref:Uncharacterized protein n=1 Tax=Mycena albidolilacea TaxID=1033008 RepID=A0AAD7ACR7_9AGAR|nr:hypothetical protein DFH08DRAFT_803359 [Mycena albidolilacea]
MAASIEYEDDPRGRSFLLRFQEFSRVDLWRWPHPRIVNFEYVFTAESRSVRGQLSRAEFSLRRAATYHQRGTSAERGQTQMMDVTLEKPRNTRPASNESKLNHTASIRKLGHTTVLASTTQNAHWTPGIMTLGEETLSRPGARDSHDRWLESTRTFLKSGTLPPGGDDLAHVDACVCRHRTGHIATGIANPPDEDLHAGAKTKAEKTRPERRYKTEPAASEVPPSEATGSKTKWKTQKTEICRRRDVFAWGGARYTARLGHEKGLGVRVTRESWQRQENAGRMRGRWEWNRKRRRGT